MKLGSRKMASLRRALITPVMSSIPTPQPLGTPQLLSPPFSGKLLSGSQTSFELLYRSRQRGFLELDLVLGKWVEEHIYSLDESGIKALVMSLTWENPDLWKWLTGLEQPPEALFSAVRDKVMNNLNSHAAPETRAVPGQLWVRRWDDIKKNPGSPVAGNQYLFHCKAGRFICWSLGKYEEE